MLAPDFSSDRFARTLGLAYLLCLAGAPLLSAGDWPHWRGPNRNGIVAEPSGWTGGKWPAGETVWTANVGAGCTSPLIVDGRLYTLGWKDGQDTVVCLDAATGKPLWSQSYACRNYGRHAMGDEGFYAGPTSTPEFDTETGLLYTLSVDGHLHCWDTRHSGRKVWGLNLYDAYGVGQRAKLTRTGHRDYGYTSAPLVNGEWLIVEVGDDEGNLMAYDKRTGKRQWVSQSKDPAGHTGGPVPMEVDGLPCLAVFTQKHLLVARLDGQQAGKTVAEFPWTTDYANSIASPAVLGSDVLITAGYNHEKLCKLRISTEGARKLWEQPYYSKVCSPIIKDGRIYWAWQNLFCLDFESGRKLWDTERGFGDPGSCILTSDDRLIVWSGNGTLSLYETAARSPTQASRLAEVRGLAQSDAWPHIALANGHLYCKDRTGHLICLPLTVEAE